MSTRHASVRHPSIGARETPSNNQPAGLKAIQAGRRGGQESGHRAKSRDDSLIPEGTSSRRGNFDEKIRRLH